MGIPIGSSHLVCLRALSSSEDHRVASPGNGQVPPLVYHDRVYHRLDTASALKPAFIRDRARTGRERSHRPGRSTRR